MGDLRDYARSYWEHASTVYGRGKTIMGWVVWIAGMAAPFGAASYFPAIPAWASMAWLGIWVAAGVVIAPFRMWKEQRETIRQLRAPGTISLRELFFHIDPNPITNYRDIGRQVLDGLSTGALTAYGREKKLERFNSMSLINNMFWEDAEFSYVFLTDEYSPNDVQAYSRDLLGHTQQYGDIRVDRAKALSIWHSRS